MLLSSFISHAPLNLQRSVALPLANCCVQLPPRCCDAASAQISQPDLDRLFSRLNHVNKTLRKRASIAIAEVAASAEVDRLLDLLSLEDVHHRRAAVQTLGMTGVQTIAPLIQLLANSDNSTVRASCAKSLAAVSLYNPQERFSFPAGALDALHTALKTDPDPVTKVSVVGCLGSLGCDGKTEDGEHVAGCPRAVDILMESCLSPDMSISATAVGALAQVAQSSSVEIKQRVIEHLAAISTLSDDDPDSGLSYVKEMAASHVDQLQGKGAP